MRKRLVDVVGGTLLAVISLPLILILAVASAALFRAWPFFIQERVGLFGKTFRIVKIRSLPRTAPSHAHKFVINEIRLPRFATLLRSTHLDELPQLWLVPIGKMSLVGPRPEMRFLHDQGDPSFAELRTSVRPGCTGLWQVSRASAGLIWDSTEYDSYYVRNNTLRLDLWVLVRTIAIMTPFASTLSLDDIPRWTRSRRQLSLLSDVVPFPTHPWVEQADPTRNGGGLVSQAAPGVPMVGSAFDAAPGGLLPEAPTP